MKFQKSTSEGAPDAPPSYDELEPSSSSSSIHHVKTPPPLGSKERPPSVKTNSASSISRLNGLPGKKNVPYKPSSDLQAHIDKLGSTIENLTTFSTGTQTEYFDVLPSFQMYQSILKRNDFEFDEQTLGNPPVYGDTTTTSPSPPTGLSPMNSNVDSAELVQSVAQRLEDYDTEGEEAFEGRYLFTDDDNDGLQRRPRAREVLSGAIATRDGSATPTPTPMGITHESFGNSVLDNIDMLPVAKTSPLSLDIFITKNVPVPNEANELESKLKEYSCGDMVNGYIVITNNLDEGVDFGLFVVTLECTLKAVHKKSVNDVIKVEKVLQKKPLKMYDLHASSNEAAVPSSAGITYQFLARDKHDGCLLGLPNDRVLKPNEKYKKFITFKFPEMLLDNSCPHGIFRHTMPPPSFGIDETAFHKRAGTISVNKALGYGFCNVRGSPMKVRDYAFQDVSVCYSIEAKFIDKHNEVGQRLAVSPNDINDPENDSKFIISKSSQFFLRFLPDVKAQIESFLSLYQLMGNQLSSIDDLFFDMIARRSTWQFMKQMNLSIEAEIDAALNKKEFSDQELKRKNLRYSTFDDSTENGLVPSSSTDQKIQPQSSSTETSLGRNVLYTHAPVDIFGKRKNRLLLSVGQIGEMRLQVKVPDKLIPYGSPKLLQKYNGLSSTILLRTPSSLSLQPVASHMMGLYNRDSESVIKDVEIRLVFDAVDNIVKPPPIVLVDFSVVAWSYKTEYPIPISFEHDFFYTKGDVPGVGLQSDDVENTKMNLQEIKDVVNHYIAFLKETKTDLSQSAYSYLKGMSKLGVKKDTIEGYFQPITSKSLLTDEWVAGQNHRWSKTLNLPMEIINKNNITLPPSFQSCLVGRVYSLQVQVKFKGGEELHNRIKLDVPVLVG